MVVCLNIDRTPRREKEGGEGTGRSAGRGRRGVGWKGGRQLLSALVLRSGDQCYRATGCCLLVTDNLNIGTKLLDFS